MKPYQMAREYARGRLGRRELLRGMAGGAEGRKTHHRDTEGPEKGWLALRAEGRGAFVSAASVWLILIRRKDPMPSGDAGGCRGERRSPLCRATRCRR